ncbi:MAG: hypothetical protein AAFN04_04890 [Pseudomonadota bacterium]
MPSAVEPVAAPLEQPTRRAGSRTVTVGDGRWVMVALAAVLIALQGVKLLFDHSLHSIDGAMQTWFALQGFASGEALGSAFQSYLGITMMLALLPVFFAFGQTLFASTFAAYAGVIAGAFAGAYAIAWFLRIIPKNLRAWAAILIVFAFYYLGRVPFDLVGYPYAPTFDPGVSLRPFRGSLAFFALPFFIMGLRGILRTHSAKSALALGAIAGVGLLWSNDAGIPLVIAMAMALTAALFPRWSLMARSLGAFALGALASSAALVMVVTHGDPSGWLHYNFVDVSGDQFWYFGPWSRESRILTPLDLPNLLTSGEPLRILSLLMLATSVIVVFVRRLRGRGSPVRDAAFVLVGASLVGTALIPQIGGHIGAEYNAITFVLGFCAPIIVFQRAILRGVKPVLRRIAPGGASYAALCAAMVMALVGVSASVSTARASDRSVYSPELGFYVTPAFKADIEAMQRLSQALTEKGVIKNRQLLSAYTSALDVAAGTKGPAPVGSLIHALGAKNRADFTRLVADRSVAAVTTIAPDYSGWEGWNLRANWPFFKALRENYTPIARNDQHVLWVRSGGIAPRDAQCEVAYTQTGEMVVTIRSERSGMGSLRLDRDREGSRRGQMLTVTEDSPFTRSVEGEPWDDFPRYGVGNATVVEVPAPVTAGEETRLTLSVLDGSDIGGAKCTVSTYEPIDFTALSSLPKGIDAYLEGTPL